VHALVRRHGREEILILVKATGRGRRNNAGRSTLRATPGKTE
jgi:hypothetical protein